MCYVISSTYLNIILSHVLQHPYTVGPGVVVAGVTAGRLRTHTHLLVEEPGLVCAETLAARCCCFSVRQTGLPLVLPATLLSTALLQDLQEHPAPGHEGWLLQFIFCCLSQYP